MKSSRTVVACLAMVIVVVPAGFFVRQGSAPDTCPAQDSCTRQLGELQRHLFKPVQAYGPWLGDQLHQVRSPEPNTAERVIGDFVGKRQHSLLAAVDWRLMLGLGFAMIVALCVLSKQLTTNLWRRCGIILAVVFIISTAGFPKSGLALKAVANPTTYVNDLPVQVESALVQSPHAIMQFGKFGQTAVGRGYANRLLEGGSLTKSERDQADSPSGVRQAVLTAPAALVTILSVGPVITVLAWIGQLADILSQLGFVLLPLALALYWFDSTRSWFWRFTRALLALLAVAAISGLGLGMVTLAYVWLYDNFTSQGWLGEAINLLACLGMWFVLIRNRGHYLRRILRPVVVFAVGLWRFVKWGRNHSPADQQPALEQRKIIDIPAKPRWPSRRIALRR